MTVKSNSEYYAARLRAERSAAEAATSEQARSAHRTLAEHYAWRLGVSLVDSPRG